MTTPCPHCGVMTAPDAQFCPSCGKAVRVGPQATRLVDGETLASSHAGQALQSEALLKQMKSAFGALLAVAILQTLAAAVVVIAAMNIRDASQPEMVAAAVVVSIIALGFYGLAIWARFAPFPAAITGLCILLTLWALDAMLDPTSLVRGLIIKIIIIIFLVRAIKAGATHRRLSKELAIQHAAA
jgi:hypothetical protein